MMISFKLVLIFYLNFINNFYLKLNRIMDKYRNKIKHIGLLIY